MPGVVGATAPPTWRRGESSLVEAFPAIDGSAPGIQAIVDRANAALAGTDGTLTGVVLALKAVLLNVVSLAAAFGVAVLVFQLGHGSSLWGLDATGSIIAYVPLLIFAFLYGLSMDYEVFMLSRMREAYDETGSTEQAIELGLARTGKLVTSGALILMFAFLVHSTGPGYEIRPPAIGLAAGIVIDATLIRALLVPALMRLLGEANRWMPEWTRIVLRLPHRHAGTRGESASYAQ